MRYEAADEEDFDDEFSIICMAITSSSIHQVILQFGLDAPEQQDDQHPSKHVVASVLVSNVMSTCKCIIEGRTKWPKGKREKFEASLHALQKASADEALCLHLESIHKIKELDEERGGNLSSVSELCPLLDGSPIAGADLQAADCLRLDITFSLKSSTDFNLDRSFPNPDHMAQMKALYLEDTVKARQELQTKFTLPPPHHQSTPLASFSLSEPVAFSPEGSMDGPSSCIFSHARCDVLSLDGWTPVASL